MEAIKDPLGYLGLSNAGWLTTTLQGSPLSYLEVNDICNELPGTILDDRNVVQYTIGRTYSNLDNNCLTSDVPNNGVTWYCNSLPCKHHSMPGQNLWLPANNAFIQSPNGQYFVMVQSNGNLGLFKGSPAGPNTGLWWTNTNGQSIRGLLIQFDNNLCLGRTDGSNAWCALNYSNFNGASTFAVLDSGNACLFNMEMSWTVWCAL